MSCSPLNALSREQARLELLGTNHVTVNGSHVLPLPDSDEPVSIFLSSGDLIELSKYRFRFSYAIQEISAASTSQLQSVYVPISPAEKGRQSLQGLATPDGKRRKVRTSLVRAADVETPSKARETFARLDALDAAPGSQGLPALSMPRTTFVQLTPRPSLTSLSLDSGSPLQRHLLGSHEPVMLTEDSLKSMEKSLDLMSIRHEIPGYGAEEGVQEELVVIDEDEEEDEDVDHQEGPGMSHAAADALSARETPQSPDEVAAKKERRRSSFLGRAWPFSSPQGFYGAERENEAHQDQPSTPERPPKEEQEHAEAEEEGDDSEEEQEADQSDILSPRLPRSLSSPGRLGSPSFHISSRRKVSLRTKTLLRSSAALVERMAASQSDSFLTVARSEDQDRPSSPLATREAEEQDDYKDDEDEVDQSLSLVEEGDEEYGGNEQDEQGEEEQEPADPVYEPEPEGQPTRGDEVLAFEPAAIANVEDCSNASPDDAEQIQKHQPSMMLPSLSRPTSRSSKRLSMPAFVGRRRSLFGLGIFPRGQTSNEAEDVVGKVDEMFATAQGSASSADSGYEGRSSGSASPDVGYQSMLTAASCENLKGPAREALRYLLSNKSKAPSPAIGSDNGDAGQPAVSASTATGGLRSLMLGRQEPMLLQRARTSKRSSLILAPGTPTADGLRLMSPQAGSTPDLAFLRHVFALPKVETDSDPQLRALRYLFAEHESVLSRAEEDGGEGYLDGADLAMLMATPAAQRTLVSAASRVARLTPTESAQQAAAVIEIPLDGSPSLLHVQDAASPSQAASLRRGNAEQSPSPLATGDDNDAVLGDETPSYKKTRRGCRGGRRRSRNFSPSIDLGAFDVEAVLADVDLPQVIPEEPLSADTEAEVEAKIPEAPAPQSSHSVAPLAPSTPASSPSKSRAVRASRLETSNKPQTAVEVLKRSGSSRGRQALTAATTANTQTPARTEKAQIAANGAPGEEENYSTQAEQEVTASPAKPTRARSTRRAAEVKAQPQDGDEEEAMSARPARRGARRAEPNKPAIEEVVSSPVKPVTRKTSTRGGAGRKQRPEPAEEDEADAERQLPASEPAMPVATRSRRGAREVAAAPSAVPAAAPTPARSTRTQKAKTTTTTTSTKRRDGHEPDDEHDQNDHDDKEDVNEKEDDDANNHEEERALRRSTRSSPVKKRTQPPREVQSSPVKPAARTTRRAAAGGGGHTKEPSVGDAEAVGATTTRTTRRKAAATAVPDQEQQKQEAEELAPVARATRSARGAKKA